MQVNILADMELCGIGVDMEGCIRARHLLGRKLKCLEKEAHRLAGMTFSLYATADIANVLYQRLKLPIPEGYNKGKQHPSTDKHCLELLRCESTDFFVSSCLDNCSTQSEVKKICCSLYI